MVDMTRTGIRCRAIREVRSHRGVVKRFTEGTIRHQIDSFGRHLICVEWDSGITAYVFPFEIEIIDNEDPFGSAA
jgi:hypothetical protein